MQTSSSNNPPSPGQKDESKEAPVPQGTVRVHYHRFDENYNGLSLWTWDAANQHTPKKNELLPAGRDGFGVYFDLNRADYSVNGSGTIGLLPRFDRDWNKKDGPDRFWIPQHGSRVYLLSAKPNIFTTKPDVAPRVMAAYADAPDSFEVVLNRLLKPSEIVPEAVTLTNGTGPVSIAEVEALVVGNSPSTNRFRITPAQPTNPVTQSYRLSVKGFGKPVSVVPRRLLDDPTHFLAGDAKLGAVANETSTSFRLFAPTATKVSILTFDADHGTEGKAAHPMQKGAKGVWESTLPGNWVGKYYAYSLEGPDLDPLHEIVDPYAINTVANSNRARITNLANTNPPGWNEARRGPAVQSPVDIVVYEMHVRDFTISPSSGVKNRGGYLGWTEAGTRLPNDTAIKTCLDHLEELGVTHVQILPVHDFANDEEAGLYNWGYITNNFFSPEGMYASKRNDDTRIRELKQLIAALHARGIGVILDVVYNHTSESAPFDRIAPGYYYRHTEDGTLANGSGCGNEFRTEAPMGRKLLIDSLKYWVQEYGVDGFRFDLMALLDQESMRQAEQELRKIRPDIVLYGEPWMAAETPLKEHTDKFGIKGTAIGAFNDDFRNSLKGAPDGNEPGWIQNASNGTGVAQGLLGTWTNWPDSPAQSINYMTCHDNLVLVDKVRLSMPQADAAQQIRVMKLGYLALFTAQGVPFIHGGEEFARSKGGNHNSYDAPDSVNQVDWTLKRKNQDLFRYVRDLIAIRKTHPLFRLRTKEEVANRVVVTQPADGLIVANIDGSGITGETWKRALVVMNGTAKPIDSLDLPEGRWKVALDGGIGSFALISGGKAKLAAKSGVILFED